MNFIVMSAEPTFKFGSGDETIWSLLLVDNGFAQRIAVFNGDYGAAFARRIADLLNRNGLVDAPLSETDLS